MNAHTEYLWSQTQRRRELVNITGSLEGILLPVTGGKLDLGPWERVFYAEFDGRRKKRVVVKVLGQ